MTFAYTATGGIPPYTFNVSAGTLPPGLTLGASSGAITGTPTTAGTYSWTARVTDSVGSHATVNSSSTIEPAVVLPLAFTGDAPDGSVGIPYSYTYTVSDGVPPYTVTLLSGTLPAGLTLSSAGVLSGTPTTVASYSWTLRATDSAGNHVDLADSNTIASSIPVTSGLVLWLDANDIAVADGAAVTSWTDRSPRHTVVASAGTPPVFRAAGMGGKPTLDPTNGGYLIAAIDWSGATGGTLFAIFKNLSSAITPLGLGFGPNGGANTCWMPFNSNVAYDANLSSGRTSVDITPQIAEILNPCLYTVYSGPSGGEMRLNGVDILANPNAFATPFDYFGTGQLIGLSGGDNRIVNQYLSAVIAYNRQLTPTEIGQVEAFLNSQWQ